MRELLVLTRLAFNLTKGVGISLTVLALVLGRVNHSMFHSVYSYTAARRSFRQYKEWFLSDWRLDLG